MGQFPNGIIKMNYNRDWELYHETASSEDFTRWERTGILEKLSCTGQHKMTKMLVNMERSVNNPNAHPWFQHNFPLIIRKTFESLLDDDRLQVVTHPSFLNKRDKPMTVMSRKLKPSWDMIDIQFKLGNVGFDSEMIEFMAEPLTFEFEQLINDTNEFYLYEPIALMLTTRTFYYGLVTRYARVFL
jgi:hypothetical protein